MSSLLSSKTFSLQKWQINCFWTRIYSVMQTHIFQQGTVSCCALGGAIKVRFLRKASEKH